MKTKIGSLSACLEFVQCHVHTQTERISLTRYPTLHLHMVIHKRVKKALGTSEDFYWMNHVGVTLILFCFNFPFLLLAQTFSTDTLSLVLVNLFYALSYSAIYFLALSGKERNKIFGVTDG